MAGLLLQYLRKFPLDYGKGKLLKWVDLSKVASPTLYRNSMGIQFELHLEEYLMKQVYLYDIYEKNTIRHLRKLIKPGAICVDCGANSGFYAMTLCALAGKKGQVHAFEPVSINFNRLMRNASLNDFPQLNANQMGLSNGEKTLEIFFGGSNLGTASMYTTQKSQKETISLRTLDGYCAEKGINHLDLLKVDVEGAELECLQGAQQILQNSPDMVLVMEIMEDNCRRAGYSAKELFDFVIKMGFKGFIPRGWPFGLKPIDTLPEAFLDNIIFLKGKYLA